MTQSQPPEPVVLAEPDPAWPATYESARDELLQSVPGAFTALEHIGSTSVPGLVAKPIIDILAGVEDLRAFTERCVGPLAAIGYRYRPEFEAVLPQRRYFRREADGGRLSVQVHVAEHGGGFWTDHLRFRDLLRSDAELRQAYAALKRRLAAEFAADRGAYTDAKGPFITETIRSRAR